MMTSCHATPPFSRHLKMGGWSETIVRIVYQERGKYNRSLPPVLRDFVEELTTSPVFPFDPGEKCAGRGGCGSRQ